jgi:3-phosphoshikimate 1-carboxyvinyltransferase
MKHFGVEVENKNYEKFYFKPQIANYKAQPYTVEGDWSGSAFLLVAGAIAGNITVNGLDISSTQADKAVLDALAGCGAKLSFGKGQIEVGPSSLKAFRFNATECPDLFPPLVALASYCSGISEIKGVSRLIHKESNRALTLQEEFDKMGIDIQLKGDIMTIKGGRVKGADVSSHHDHRIAMACAIAGLRATDEMVIEDAEAVDKSYPEFYDHLRILKADVSDQHATTKV